ncbi:hypothetical protein [Streptomyces vietnamensis]|uniref:hypothetical protein n=1 Tax=Streptomyces vietnamensis TaxID=362257 RepID=UPI00069856B9|nr:hypothetical protein [Streptomyces vietnamensis]
MRTPPTPPAPATVAGRALSEWSRDGRFGTWYALGPADADGPPLGVLRIHRALLTPSGARERLTAAVRSVAKLRLPGVPATVDLLREAGDVWLIVARPPARTVSDLLATGAPGLDEGSAASVLNETAQTLLALHAAGLAHGSLTPDHVVLAPDGTALLVEASLAAALTEDGASTVSPRDADIAAWAALARTLGTAWAAPGTPAAELFARCSATAGSEGLAAARTTLTSGRAALPRDFLRRTALRTAAAAALAELAEPASRTEPATKSPGASGRSEATESVEDAGAVEDTAAAAPVGVAPDERDTLLGKRHRSVPATPLTPVPGGAEDDGEIVLRFGPGVPRSEEEALRALWAAPAPAPTPPHRRRRRAGLLGATAALAAVAVVLWLLLRPTTGPVVTAVRVTAPSQRLTCGGTAEVTGVVTTDGHAGPFRYRWLRSDGQRSEVLTRTARGGEHEVALHLRWTVRGPGLFHGTARLQVLRPDTPPLEAEAAFTYACAG